MGFDASGNWTPDTNVLGSFGSGGPLAGSGINMSGLSPATLALFGGGSDSSNPFNLPSLPAGFGSGIGGGAGGAVAGTGFGLNIPTFQLGLGALGSLGSLISGFGALGLANKQLKLTTAMDNANLANSTQAYNTNLAGLAQARGAWENQTPQQIQQYITANSLKKFSV